MCLYPRHQIISHSEFSSCVFSNEGKTIIYCDNMVVIIMANSKNTTERAINMDIQNVDLQEWYDLGKLFLEHISTEINPS